MDTNPAPLTFRAVEGWLFGDAADAQPRIRDLDLGERLGYSRPRDLLPLLDRLEEAGKLPGIYVRDTVSRTSMPQGGVREDVRRERWLTEAQALKVAAKSETEPADEILDEMIRVFMLARRGLLPDQAPLTRAVALKFLVDDALACGHNGAAVCFINGARALDKGAPGQLSLVDVGAKVLEPPRVDYRARITEHVAAHGPVASTKAIVLGVTGRDAVLYGTIGRMLVDGGLVRGPKGITVATSAGQVVQ